MKRIAELTAMIFGLIAIYFTLEILLIYAAIALIIMIIAASIAIEIEEGVIARALFEIFIQNWDTKSLFILLQTG